MWSAILLSSKPCCRLWSGCQSWLLLLLGLILWYVIQAGWLSHLRRFSRYPTPTLGQYDVESRLKFSASISQNWTSNFSSLRFELILPELPYKIDIAIIYNDGKIIQTCMKHYLLLLLRNAMKRNSIKFAAARLHVSSDKFWNCMKYLKCINVKKSCLLVNKWTVCSTKLKKKFVKYLIAYNVKNFERNLRNQHIFYAARNVCRVSDPDTSPFISFVSTTLPPENDLFPEQLETFCYNHCALICLSDWTFVWEK